MIVRVEQVAIEDCGRDCLQSRHCHRICVYHPAESFLQVGENKSYLYSALSSNLLPPTKLGTHFTGRMEGLSRLPEPCKD
ncbi:hypothetical protein GDO78_013756 [Eleutherodactylus coqui]|uniref:Uncharacterized protein n=1 Tax=Eleutherodactylus coqui TaxID=57060 RepID=A0A8J6E2J1_ELECQ|nr:hypothetical protein GDO78_013756 [Eleutherodactylus coqui]